jgi:hypothetical protein
MTADRSKAHDHERSHDAGTALICRDEAHRRWLKIGSVRGFLWQQQSVRRGP